MNFPLYSCVKARIVVQHKKNKDGFSPAKLKRRQIMKMNNYKNLKLKLAAFVVALIFLPAFSSLAVAQCAKFEGDKSPRKNELDAMVSSDLYQITVVNRSSSPISVKTYGFNTPNPGKTPYSTNTIAAGKSGRLGVSNDYYEGGTWGIQVGNSCIRYIADVGTLSGEMVKMNISYGMMTISYGLTDKELNCATYGYTSPTQDIDGVWKFEHSSGLLVYEGTLYISGRAGKVMTKYFDEDSNQTRTVEQRMILCQSASGMILLGFMPIIRETGATADYNADNFSMKRLPNGTFDIYNKDDGGSEGKVDIKDFRELTADNKVYLSRPYF